MEGVTTLHMQVRNIRCKKAHLLCTGCPESRIDSAKVRKFISENGWNTTCHLKEADLILFRACGLNQKATEEALQIIRTVKAEKKENSRLIVWGCLPKIDPEALRTEYCGVTFGEEEISVLGKILKAKKPIEEVTANRLMPFFKPYHAGFDGYFHRLYSLAGGGPRPPDHVSVSQNESIFHIKVSTGCLGNCSFCGVRKSRGLLRSKSIDSVLSEFTDGLEKGFQYFSLLGTDVGAYGRDFGCSLVDLLLEMIKKEGNYKIGLRNVNPYHLQKMFEELKPIFSSGKIWLLSSAVESGSDRILKLMCRKYEIEDFKKPIRILNKEYPNIFLRTQMIVGFPTETREDFQKSLHLLDELRFDWVEVYRFSTRPGTLAATMAPQISEKVKEFRFRRLTLKAMTQRHHRKMREMLQSCFVQIPMFFAGELGKNLLFSHKRILTKDL